MASDAIQSLIDGPYTSGEGLGLNSSKEKPDLWCQWSLSSLPCPIARLSARLGTIRGASIPSRLIIGQDNHVFRQRETGLITTSLEILESNSKLASRVD